MESGRAFTQSVVRHPKKTAITTLDGTSYSYEEFDQRTSTLAHALNDRIGNERSASLLGNGFPALEVFIAAQKRGHANVPLNTRASVTEIEFMAENADARTLIFDDANADLAEEYLPRTDFESAIHVGEQGVSGNEVPIESFDTIVSTTDSASLEQKRGIEAGVYYTSGTSGKPKGVLTDQEMTWFASTNSALGLGLEADDIGLLTTPLFHQVTAASWAMPHFQMGAEIVPQPSFDPEGALDAIERHGITGLLAVPTQLKVLTKVQKENPRDLVSLTHIRTGGAPIDPDTVNKVREYLTEDLYNAYGITEGVGSMTVGGPDVQEKYPGSVGRQTFNWDVRVVEASDPDEDPDLTATVDNGEEGEIVAKGESAGDGYIDRPEAEKQTFCEGWIRTGDVAKVTEDGDLYIVDRIDNMIVSGSENVYPQTVESVLEDHSAVEEAAVIGCPHEKWGETVKAIVKPQSGQISPGDLDTFCKDHNDLADYKRPREYEFVSESLPRSPLGNLRRSQIENRFS